MSKLLSMTFHESYGDLPSRLLTLYRRHNVSPSDHDLILMACGSSYSMAAQGSVDWQLVLEFVLAHVDGGTFRLPLYL